MITSCVCLVCVGKFLLLLLLFLFIDVRVCVHVYWRATQYCVDVVDSDVIYRIYFKNSNNGSTYYVAHSQLDEYDFIFFLVLI